MKRIILLIIGFFPVTLVNAQNALQIPSTLSGKNITLNLQNGSKQFFTRQTASTMGANGNILGPTLNL